MSKFKPQKYFEEEENYMNESEEDYMNERVESDLDEPIVTNEILTLTCVFENKKIVKKLRSYKEFELCQVLHVFDTVEVGRSLASLLYKFANKLNERAVDSTYEAWAEALYLDVINLKFSWHGQDQYAFRSIKEIYFPEDFNLSEIQQMMDDLVYEAIVRMKEIAADSREAVKANLIYGQ